MKNKHKHLPITKPFIIIDFASLGRFVKGNLLFFALLTGFILLLYGNVIPGEFLTADDTTGFLQDPNIHNLPNALKSFQLQYIVTVIIANTFGLQPQVFHVLSILLHALNTFVFAMLIFITFGKRISIIAAFIFASHPAASEAVCWLTASGYLYTSFFLLSTIFFYALFKKSGKSIFYKLALCIYTLGLVVHRMPWMLTLPFVLTIWDMFVLEKKIIFKTVKPYLNLAAFFLITLVYIGISYKSTIQMRPKELQSYYYFDSSQAPALTTRIPYSISTPFLTYAFPLKLEFFHESAVSSAQYSNMIIFTSILFLFLAYGFIKPTTYSGLIMCIIMSILPVFSPVQVAWFAADRYGYFGLFFFCAGLSIALTNCEKFLTDKSENSTSAALLKVKPYIRRAFLILCVGLVSAYSLRTILRTQDFKTSKNLWLSVQKTSPNSYRVYNNLGDVFAKEQNWPLAIQSFETAIRIFPDYADAMHNLGYTYLQMGDYENAKKYLLLSFQKNGGLYQALEKLAQIELIQGNKDQAKNYFDRAVLMDPDFAVYSKYFDKE